MRDFRLADCEQPITKVGNQTLTAAVARVFCSTDANFAFLVHLNFHNAEHTLCLDGCSKHKQPTFVTGKAAGYVAAD